MLTADDDNNQTPRNGKMALRQPLPLLAWALYVLLVFANLSFHSALPGSICSAP